MAQHAMQETTFLILTALADSSQHGYGIMTAVREFSHGRVRLRAGTLYAALDRLTAEGLVAVDRQEIVANRLRRYYALTPAGTKQLAAEATRLHANAIAALSRLKLGEGISGSCSSPSWCSSSTRGPRGITARRTSQPRSRSHGWPN